MRRKYQDGFSAVELLLLIVIVGIIGAIGWFVWQARSTNPINTSKPTGGGSNAINSFDDCVKADNPVAESFPEQCTANGKTFTNTSASSDETKTWLDYEAPGKEFSVKIPDGWKLERYMKEAMLYSWASKNIQYKFGSVATVTEVEGGRDGAGIAFSLTYHKDATTTPKGTKQTTFKTTAGDVVEKYYFKQDIEPEGPDLPKGAEQFAYVVKHGSETITVVHHVAAASLGEYEITGTEQTKIIEMMIKTTKFL